MSIEDDVYLNRMFKRRNLSRSRKTMYIRILKNMHDITGLTPTELIKEAKQEEKPFIENNQAVFLDIHDRKITEYLDLFYDYIENKKLKKETMNTEMGLIRSFYNEYDIVLPKKIQITFPKKMIKKGDIPDLEDIKKALEATKHLKYKAIILLLATSGMRSGDIRKLTIKDFLEATKEYHDGSLKQLLKNKEEIIPCWEFIPRKTERSSNFCITFNTPETSEYIINSIKKRINNGEDVKEDSPLFITKRHGFYTLKGFTHICKSINNELFGKSQDGRDFFRAHNLRKFFLSTFRQTTKDLFALKIVAGHSLPSKNDETYQEILKNETKTTYLKVIPYLSIKDTKVNIIDDDATKKLKAEIESKDKEIEEIRKQQEMILEMLKERDIK